MNTKKISRLAIIAGLYAALTIVFSFISYGEIQVRLSEILILLCFFNKDYILSVTFGCLIANLFSPFGIYDIIFGTVATLISAILVSKIRNMFVAALMPVILNGLIVGVEIALLSDINIYLSMIFVATGELIAMMIGYFVMRKLKRNNTFIDLIC